MRIKFTVVALSLCTSVCSQSLPPSQRLVYVGIGNPCPFPQARISEGVAAAKKDIRNGRIVKRRHLGAAPVPPSNAELRRAEVESEVWKSLGVVAEYRMASDISECRRMPFEQGYDQEVDHFLQTKLGSNYVEKVEQITDERTKKRQ